MVCHSTLDRISASTRNISVDRLGQSRIRDFDKNEYYKNGAYLSALINYNSERCFDKDKPNDETTINRQLLCNYVIKELTFLNPH